MQVAKSLLRAGNAKMFRKFGSPASVLNKWSTFSVEEKGKAIQRLLADIPLSDRVPLLHSINTTLQVEVDNSAHVNPTKKQLTHHFLKAAIPFFGFGFMDNAVMILFGEAIDLAIVSHLGFSCMFAAGIGNTVSDCTGLAVGDAIDKLGEKIGVPQLELHLAQSKVARRVESAGKLAGLAAGCVAGMCPLLFLHCR